MLRGILLSSLLILSIPKAFAENNSAEFWDITNVHVREVPDSGVLSMTGENRCESANSEPTSGDISWDEIVAIGRQFWDIIVANKPVLETQTPIVHAIPKGLHCWTDLENWKAPIARSYEVVYQNKFGMEVVKFRFRLQFSYGGSHKGRGRYLANVTVLPAEVNVSWGYKFNAKLDVAQALNMGTKADPIAELEMNLHWNVSTWIKESENSVHFSVDGNGAVRFDH
jgi:hypothetical protein